MHYISRIDLKLVRMSLFEMQCAYFLCTVCMLKRPEPLLACYFYYLGIGWHIFDFFLYHPRIYTDITQYCNNYSNKYPLGGIVTHLMPLLFIASSSWILKMFPLGRCLVLWI